MDSANHQWLQELEKDDVGELELINPLSMQKLAESLANELWGQPPQEQQEQHDNQQEQCVYPNPSLTGSPFVRDTKSTRAIISESISNNVFSFTDGSSCPLNFAAKEYNMQQSAIGTATTKCCSSSTTTVRGGGRRPTTSVDEHVIAERKRREQMHHQFATLASIVPDITKTDKVSLLSGTIEYVHKLRGRLKVLEGELQSTTGSNTGESPAFNTRCCLGGSKPNDGDAKAVSPKIEVDVQGTTVLLRVVCREKGVLEKVLMELEKHGISIVHTNVVPFAESSLNMTITAQMQDGSSTTTELVKALKLALRNY